MANTKTIQTRIKNRFDTLANWQVAGVTLLPGEIALASVTVQQTDEATGKVVNVPAVLMKVGDYKRDADGNYILTNGEKTVESFSNLPWLSARAADVYDWAKGSSAEAVKVKVITGYDDNGAPVYDEGNTDGINLSTWLKKVYDKGNLNAINIADNAAAIGLLNDTADKAGSVANSIKTAIEALDFADGSAVTDTTTTTKSNFVTVVTQTDGKIAVTKKAIAEVDLPSISSDKITVGTGTEEGTLSKKLSDLDINLAEIRTTITGGVHFIGTVTSKPSDKTLEVNDHDIILGDIVIYKGTDDTDYKEYICTAVNGSGTEKTVTWEELGDVTRIGALETKIDGLDVTDTNDVAKTHKFVSQVTQTDGKISVTYTQPSAADVSYDGDHTTVDAELDDHVIRIAAVEAKLDGVDKVTDSIEDALDALDYSSPNTSGNTTDFQFISTVSQTDGLIAATKHTIPDATTSNKGVVKLSSATDSTSEDLAATPKAVKAAYDKADNAQQRVADVESNYVKFVPNSTSDTTKGKLYVGKTDTTNVLIFDCGGAADL